jgi:hypothetical protein
MIGSLEINCSTLGVSGSSSSGVVTSGSIARKLTDGIILAVAVATNNISAKIMLVLVSIHLFNLYK